MKSAKRLEKLVAVVAITDYATPYLVKIRVATDDFKAHMRYLAGNGGPYDCGHGEDLRRYVTGISWDREPGLYVLECFFVSMFHGTDAYAILSCDEPANLRPLAVGESI